jgi:hypothetical protein
MQSEVCSSGLLDCIYQHALIYVWVREALTTTSPGVE